MTKGGRVAIGAAVVAALVLVASIALAVRQGSRTSSDRASPAGSTPAAITASPTPTTPTPQPSAMSPFTGLPVTSERPVLAVKIDNVSPARPQTGLGQADIIYMEQVEGGLSRLMAIYSSSVPSRVGPVRSARESDLQLLSQFGRPGLAFSGANATVTRLVQAASVVDLEQDADPSAYARSFTRAAPHNLYADPRSLIDAGLSKGISVAGNIGFRFGPLPAGMGRPALRKTVSYPSASVSFRWSAADHGWAVTLDGRPDVVTDQKTDGDQLAPATVVIQYVSITASSQHDVLGNPTPYTHTVGSGKAVILRNGRSIAATWSRPDAASGTTYTTAATASGGAAGQLVPFATGQVWVVFAQA